MKLLMGATGLILIYLAASGKLRSVIETLILPGGLPGAGGSARKSATKETATTQTVVANGLTPRR